MELIKLRAAYPYPDRSVDEMRVLADMWQEDMEHINDEALTAAIREHRQKSKYWPTVAEILDHASWHMRVPPGIEWKAAPPNEEQIEHNLEMVKTLIAETFKEIP